MIHTVKTPIDDGSEISFSWHFKRGTLEKNMSGFDLASFVLKEMPSIIPLLSHMPRAQKEFEAMMILLATSPKEVTHRLIPWIRSVTHTESDDIIHMSFYDKTIQKSTEQSSRWSEQLKPIKVKKEIQQAIESLLKV